MLKLAPDNALIVSFNPSLEMIELTQQKKKNKLLKKLLKQNRKAIANEILCIGEIIAYNKETPERKVNKLRFVFP